MKELKSNIFPVLCLSGFIIIAYLITKGATMNFDIVVQNAVFAIRCNPLTSFFTALTHTGDWQVVVALCAGLLFFSRTRYTYGIPLAYGALGGTFLYEILKYIFQRTRPDASLHLINQGGFSFPSGHSLTIMLVYGLFILLIRKEYLHKNKTAVTITTVLIGLYIFLIGFSRIYVGVHYPTDVLGGWLLSLFILWLVAPLFSNKQIG